MKCHSINSYTVGLNFLGHKTCSKIQFSFKTSILAKSHLHKYLNFGAKSHFCPNIGLWQNLKLHKYFIFCAKNLDFFPKIVILKYWIKRIFSYFKRENSNFKTFLARKFKKNLGTKSNQLLCNCWIEFFDQKSWFSP